VALARRNPITGAEEAREYVKAMGAICLGRITVISSRCVPARRRFYDKRLESGIVNISGLRSGCRNTIMPAGVC